MRRRWRGKGRPLVETKQFVKILNKFVPKAQQYFGSGPVVICVVEFESIKSKDRGQNKSKKSPVPNFLL
jgi:hypothetical protein